MGFKIITKSIIILSVLFAAACSNSGKTVSIEDKEDITAILDRSSEAWNKMDFEGYMESYWKSDSLKFISATRGIGYGWQKTLDGYKDAYPNKDYTGELVFKLDSFEYLGSEDYMLVIGSYHLTRKVGNAMGYFTLIWEKIDGRWVTTTDYTN